MPTEGHPRPARLESISFLLVGLSVTASALSLTAPGDPAGPQLGIAAGLIAGAGGLFAFLKRRTARGEGTTLATMILATVLSLTLVAGDCVCQVAVTGRLPQELILLMLTRDAALLAVGLSVNLVCLRLAGGLSVALMLFVSVLTEHRVIHLFMTAYALVGSYWLILLYWSMLTIKLVEGKSRRPAVSGVLVWGSLVALLTIGVIGPRQTLGVLAEWLSTSGGTTKLDEDARSGVGDGPNLVKGTETSRSTGPTDSDVFLESQERSLYDASNEKWGEPEKVIKRDQSLAVAVESAPRESHEEKTRQPNPTREFSLVRKKPGGNTPPQVAANAAYFLKGDAPAHIRQVAFDTFDGRSWKEPELGRESTDLTVAYGGWLATPPIRSAIWAGERSYRVLVGKIDSTLIPLPAYSSAFRIDKVDRPGYFQSRQAEIQTFRSDSGLPRQTSLDVVCRSLDPGRLRQLTFLEGGRYAMPKYLATRVPSLGMNGNPGANQWSLDARVKALARAWAGDLPRGWAQIERVVETLRASYRHEPGTALPPDTTDAVAAFLLDKKVGDDHAFATAACLLLRELGYPTRFVEGFYASPERADKTTGQIPIHLPGDLHVWPEVLTPEGDWIVLEPTPGFEVLGPSATLLRRLVAVCKGTFDAMRRHPLASGVGFVALVVLVAARRGLASGLVTLAWYVERRGEPRRQVVATLRLLERRAKIAGRPRPPGTTPRHWFGWMARDVAGEPTARRSLEQLLAMSDWALYSPDDLSRPRNGSPGDVLDWCRICAREWTCSRLRSNAPRTGRGQPRRWAAALALAFWLGNAGGTLGSIVETAASGTAVSSEREATAPTSEAPPRPKPVFQRLDPRDEMNPLERLNDLSMQGATAAWFFLVGISVGSFLNVVIYRMPRGLPLWGRSSHCPRCRARLTFRENIPLLGWLRLRGRCASCSEPISPRYPSIELATGLITLGLLYLELLSGGTSIPSRQPNHYAGVVWIIWYPKWDLITLYLYHMTLLCGILSIAMIVRDGSAIPRRLLILLGLVGVTAPVFAPWLHPVLPFQARPDWVIPAGFTPASLLTSLLGGAIGGLGGAWLAPGSRGRASGAMLGLAGIYLGWQAVASILAIGAILWVISLVALGGARAGRSLPILLGLAVLGQILVWRQFTGLPYWPAQGASPLAFLAGASLVGVAGVLARRAELGPWPTPIAEPTFSLPDDAPPTDLSTGYSHAADQGSPDVL